MSMEKREYERFDINEVEADLFTKNHPTIGKFSGRLENISFGGVMISLPAPLEEEPNRVFVSFMMPSGEKLEFVRARVARICEINGRAGYGLAFFPLEGQAKEALAQIIEKLTHQA